jgi:hypothetical protein
MIRIAATMLIAGFLGGCAAPGAIVPGTSSTDELHKRLGPPTDKRSNPQGGEFWEYAYGPEGTETWLYTIDQQRRVRSATQLLTEERLRLVVAGKSTENEVRALLGKPGSITRHGSETVWEWRVSIGPDLGVYVVRFGTDGRAIQSSALKDYSTSP